MSAILDTPVAIRRAAMDLLARREHGRGELRRKLCGAGAEPEWVEAALERLESEGLLSESRYTSSFIASRAGRGQGPLRIREELLSRGIATEQVAEALEAAEVDWDACLVETWRRKFGSFPVDARERAKQARFLSYRGFSAGAISRLLSRRLEDEA